MIYIHPQWQGSGFRNDLKIGSETLELFFKETEKTVIPLSDQELTTIDEVNCLAPILEQTNSFRRIVAEHKPLKMSTIGGDCGIEVIPISYLNQQYEEDLCVLWIDAHADLNTPESSPSKNFHGMPLRTLLGEGNDKMNQLLFSTIQSTQICFVGLRDVDESEKEYIQCNHIASVSKCDFSAIKEQIHNFRNVYIHLDLDVLDKSEFKHTMFPTNKGYTIDEVYNLITTIKSESNVVGMCITESTATTIKQLEPIRKLLEEVKL